MLAPFFALGRFLGTLGLSWAFLGCLLAVLAGFCASWGAPGSILEGLGDVFGASEARFSWVSDAYGHAFRTSSRYAKTYEKPEFFLGFNHIARVAHKAKNDVKSIQELVEQSFPQTAC